MNISSTVLGIVVIWLSILSYILYKRTKLIGDLFPKLPQKDEHLSFLQKLDVVIEELGDVKKREAILNKNIREFSIEGMKHVQKYALLRYNPYGDTGGDQSFSLCLLDQKGNGVLVTSLHTRAGTRIYAKNIKDGKSEIELSKEEEKTVALALE